MTAITRNSQVEIVVRKAKGLPAIIPEFLRLWYWNYDGAVYT